MGISQSKQDSTTTPVLDTYSTISPENSASIKEDAISIECHDPAGPKLKLPAEAEALPHKRTISRSSRRLGGIFSKRNPEREPQGLVEQPSRVVTENSGPNPLGGDTIWDRASAAFPLGTSRNHTRSTLWERGNGDGDLDRAPALQLSLEAEGPSGWQKNVSRDEEYARMIQREEERTPFKFGTQRTNNQGQNALGKGKQRCDYDSDELYARQIQEEEDERIAKSLSAQEIDEQTLRDWFVALKLQEEITKPLEIPKRDCAVCDESFLIPELPALLNCKHPPQTCKTCFQRWISEQLTEKGWNKINCPECKAQLEHEEVKTYAAPDVWEKYDRLSAQSVFASDPNFRWCLTSGCRSGQIHEAGLSDPEFTCISCHSKFCIVCKVLWHQGETCKEYNYKVSGQQARDQAVQEAASEEAVGKLSKKCPGRGCGYNIQKIAGCDHMTCTRCGYEFCWRCLADYASIRRIGNKAHNRECSLYM